MTVSVSFEEGNLVVIRGSGELKRDEVDQTKRQIYNYILANGPIYMLILIDEAFKSFEAFASWEDIEEDAVIQPNVKRLALVGDLRWRDQALLFLITAVASFQIEYFKPEQEEFARVWLLASAG
ncbi:MAG: STAS/SEC14 domain-containing protein [Polaromonas sp.]|nr:STAS/SEC14 domain-containing protein [Polaromonas sp.]